MGSHIVNNERKLGENIMVRKVECEESGVRIMFEQYEEIVQGE